MRWNFFRDIYSDIIVQALIYTTVTMASHVRPLQAALRQAHNHYLRRTSITPHHRLPHQLRPFSRCPTPRARQHPPRPAREDTYDDDDDNDDVDEEDIDFDALTPAEQTQYMKQAGEQFSPAAEEAELRGLKLEDELPQEATDLEPEPSPTQGFFADGEKGIDNLDDEEFDMDDISSTAHGELEQVREVREFLRVAGWDMPLLYREL